MKTIICLMHCQNDNQMNNQYKFTAFLSKVQFESIFPNCMKQVSKKYTVNTSQLIKVSPVEISRLRKIVLNENEAKLQKQMSLQWSDCQKKIFNWIILCYAHMHRKDILELSEQDLQQLADITTNKPIPQIKYQICSIIKQDIRPKWTQEQDMHLYQVLAVQKKYKEQKQWMHISKEIFLRGDHKTYKNGKSCRERWFNHVDPALNKEWTQKEDLTMLHSVSKEGKKWSLISSYFNHSKSEHMIKNRYNSLLKKARKQQPHLQEEDDLLTYLIRGLKRNDVIKVKSFQKPQGKPMMMEIHQKQPQEQKGLFANLPIFPSKTLDINEYPFAQVPIFENNPLEIQNPRQRQIRLSQSIQINSQVFPPHAPPTPGSDLPNYLFPHMFSTNFQRFT